MRTSHPPFVVLYCLAMDVFGSPEEDPLLHGDQTTPSEGESAEPNAPDESAESGGAQSSRTVFQSGSQDGVQASRVFIRSTTAAAQGQLTELNATLDQGWRLASVELRTDSPSQSSRPTPETVSSIAFVLRRIPSQSDSAAD